MTAHLASWLRRRELDDHAEQAIQKAVREAKADLPPHPNAGSPAGDEQQLRGIPVVGVHGGLGGTITGTNPLTATLQNEERAEREAARAALDALDFAS